MFFLLSPQFPYNLYKRILDMSSCFARNFDIWTFVPFQQSHKKRNQGNCVLLLVGKTECFFCCHDPVFFKVALKSSQNHRKPNTKSRRFVQIKGISNLSTFLNALICSIKWIAESKLVKDVMLKKRLRTKSSPLPKSNNKGACKFVPLRAKSGYAS